MDFNKIRALVHRDLLIIRRSKWRLVEIFYFPITTIIIWGFFAIHSKSFYFEAGLLVLIVNIFLNFAFVAQSTVNMQMMQDSWSGSLKQLFLSGVSEVEYVAHSLAQELMTRNEPIPDFDTRFPNILERSIAAPFQTYNKEPLYKGLVEKAAILFYLMIKRNSLFLNL